MKDNAALKNQLKSSFLYHLTRTLAKRYDKACTYDRYLAMALSIRDLMTEKWIATKETMDEKDHKAVYYISLEFLMGRTLGNAMINLDVFQAAKKALAELGFDLEEIREEEVDAGLGNGGLGRLAACYLDSLATLQIPSRGYGIRYNYGIFNQLVVDGYQVEEPDNWLRNGNPWEIRRAELVRTIHFYGRTEKYPGSSNKYRKMWVETEDVQAMPYDTPVPGYDNNTVNTLRLWSAESLYGFNLSSFNRGDYVNANIEASMTENITKVLYPNDNNYEGKELRLKQQYFMVSATLQDIIGKHKYNGDDIRVLHHKAAIQLNDTHPALAIPELMRLLVDIEGLEWEEAWDICAKTFNYTNHTLMSEALEKWPVAMMERLLPRIMEIIYDINFFFLREVSSKYPGNMDILRRLSIIEEGQEKMVRMAYMAVIASGHVNGVAALHTELLKNGLFKDFSEFYPHKFINVTNGITPRRWLKKANTPLSDIITDHIGGGWVKNLDELKKLEKLSSNKGFLREVMSAKHTNKLHLAETIYEQLGVKVDPNALFDVQVKRLHEYKRQLLNIIQTVALYLEMKDSPKASFVPRVKIFGAKAAPGYYMAKMVIKLINAVGATINNDKSLKDRLKVVFMPNYRVSLAEKIIPAADLSEQISLAGTEASGTGNMKFALNGALTIGTMDGANVEMHDAVGAENIFIFGLRVNEVQKLREIGYHPRDFVERSSLLRRAIDLVRSGFFSPECPELFNPLIDSLNHDHYMVCADFDSYHETQRQVSELFLDKDEWAKKAVLNIANMGMFSSDRSIMDYASKIWHAHPLPVKMPGGK